MMISKLWYLFLLALVLSPMVDPHGKSDFHRELLDKHFIHIL